jgi:hypothetical protein
MDISLTCSYPVHTNSVSLYLVPFTSYATDIIFCVNERSVGFDGYCEHTETLRL